MGVADEKDVELLRRKAAVLESENERMSSKLAALLRENLELKGMSTAAIEKNLPGLLEQVTARPSSSGVTRSGNEGRPRDPNGKGNNKDPQEGHGPTPQPNLEIIPETFDLDEADQVCPVCADQMQVWAGKEDEVDVIESVQRKWIIKRCSLTK